MDGRDNWQNEPRDERGRWTTSGAASSRGETQVFIDGVNAALSGQPIAVQDRLNAMLRRFDRNVLGDVGTALAGGKADGAGVLADTLNQLSLYAKSGFSQSDPEMIAALRDIANGLRSNHDGQSRQAAVARLQDLLSRPELADRIAQTLQAVETVKLANIAELARVLQNEAGSTKDHPIMEAVGHTVLNRMQRNETNLVIDVSSQYSYGRNPTEPDTRTLATRLLNGQLPDNTGGATSFYQPYAMAHPNPVPRDENKKLLIESPPKGYEYVPGVTVKDANNKDVPAFSVRPTWADGMRQVRVLGIPDRLAKFFVAPGSRHVR
jgi:hypothetical protein